MGRDALREKYDLLAWRYSADLPMTADECDTLQLLHSMFVSQARKEGSYDDDDTT